MEYVLHEKSKFTGSQIVVGVKRVYAAFGVSDICREMSIINATFYKRRAKYGGMCVSMMSRMEELEDGIRRLKRKQTDEIFKLMIATPSGNLSMKCAQWNKPHELRKNKIVFVHFGPLLKNTMDNNSWKLCSNRGQT